MIIFSVKETVPFYVIVMAISVSACLSLLPVTIGGFGAREGVYIYILSEYGVSIEKALTVAFIEVVLLFTILAGLIAFIILASNRFLLEF